jgi:hypothetical protein
LKHYYFNNTNHGGSLGNGGKDIHGEYTLGAQSGDHCYPLMQLCQRNIMWKLGLGNAYFESLNSQELPNNDIEETSGNAVEETNQLEFGII